MESWPNDYSNDKILFQIISVALERHPYLIDLIFNTDRPETQLSTEELIQSSCCYSSGEKILIRVALDLWNSTGKAKLGDIINSLDPDNFKNVLYAISIYPLDDRSRIVAISKRRRLNHGKY